MISDYDNVLIAMWQVMTVLHVIAVIAVIPNL